VPAAPITFLEFQSLVHNAPGVRVTRIHAVGARMWIELQCNNPGTPFLTLALEPCAAFLDSGIAGRALSQASLGRTTDIGADAARVLGRQDVEKWLELRLEASDDRSRRFRAVAREVLAIPGTLESVTS
jgi:hypothetical protein